MNKNKIKRLLNLGTDTFKNLQNNLFVCLFFNNYNNLKNLVINQISCFAKTIRRNDVYRSLR